MPKKAARPPASSAYSAPFSLGIEGGGTRTTVLMLDAKDRVMADFHAGPAVLPLLSDRELFWHLREIASRLPAVPHQMSIGLAGVRQPADAARLRRAANRVWPKVPCHATNDLETALAAAPSARPLAPRVLILSGTGSCCFGRHPDGRTAKVGGRGHVIGDRGSACDIGLRALRAVIADLDHQGSMGALGAALLNALLFTDSEQLIPWSVQADKTEIAGLAVAVFAAARNGDRRAQLLLRDAAEMLADDACACARQLAREEEPIQFVLNGGVLLKNPGFAKQVAARIRTCWPNAKVVPLQVPSVHGAIRMARTLPTAPVLVESAALSEDAPPGFITNLESLARSPTEQRNPKSLQFDRLSIREGIRLMLNEEERLPPALLAVAGEIEKTVQAVVRAFESGGRLFYIGAGTSGRLGVLDASEIPPTFRAPREQVQGMIAGGRQALWSAVEGAEDDVHAGRQAIRNRQLGDHDVLIGIAASGRTPYVWGAMHEARRRGAFTVLLCCNPAIREAASGLKKNDLWRPQQIIAPDVGPEVLTGSTRLKSGTATKLILNMITTLAMTKTGKVVSNLMVDVNPSNVKLRDRAIRILQQLTGCSAVQAREALLETGWSVKQAYDKLGPLNDPRRKRKKT